MGPLAIYNIILYAIACVAWMDISHKKANVGCRETTDILIMKLSFYYISAMTASSSNSSASRMMAL